jgi:chorismate dehydratase
MAPDVEAMLLEQDAGLVIGDPALQIDRSRYFTLDLAEEWIRRTGKPFVFAFWAARASALREARSNDDLAGVFQRSRDHGLEPASLNQIASEWAPRLRLREDEVRNYLTGNIHYHLDADCLEGLQLFYRYAAEVRALPEAPEMRFVAAPNSALV